MGGAEKDGRAGESVAHCAAISPMTRIARFASFARARAETLTRLLLAGLQLGALLWFADLEGLPLDDAWIHQVVGRTFAESGTLGYAPDQYGAAATSYLWAAVLAVNFAVLRIDPVVWAFVLNAACTLLAGQLLYSILRAARPAPFEPRVWAVVSWGAALLATTNANVLWFAHSGMEAPALVALSLAAIWGVVRDVSAKRRLAFDIGAGVAAGLLALTRPECFPLGPLLAGYLLVRRRGLVRALAVGSPALLATAAYLGFNRVWTGRFLPTTLSGRRWLWFDITSGLSRWEQVKLFGDEWLARLDTYCFDTSKLALFLLLGLAVAGAVRVARSRSDGARLLLLWALAHVALYVVLLPTPGHGGRYQPFLPLLLPALVAIGAAGAVADLVALLRPHESRWSWLALGGIAPWFALAIGPACALREANALAVAHVQTTELGMGALVSELPGDGVVASFDIGGVGWSAGRPILDAGGLSDPRTADLLRTGRIWEHLRDRGVRYLVLPEGYERVLPVPDHFAARLRLAGNPAVRLLALRELETPLDRWLPGFKATLNAAPKQVLYRVEYTGQGPLQRREEPVRDGGREVKDPEGLIAEQERVLTSHMLAILEANGLPIDVAVASAPAPPASGADCSVALGPWGVEASGCAAVGDRAVFRAALFEQLERYLDVGDLGGALRNVAHVAMRVRRMSDPGFDLPLPPVLVPRPYKPPTSSLAGFALFGGALFVSLALGSLVARRARRSERSAVGSVRSDAAAVSIAVLVAAIACGCAGGDDPAVAVSRGRGALASALGRGAGVDTPGRGGRTALLAAAASGDVDSMVLLLDRRANVDARDAQGATALHWAARSRCIPCIAVLADAGAKGDVGAGPRKRTALHEAAQDASSPVVRALLEAGAEPHAKDAFGETPLHLLARGDAARAGDTASLLLGAGADASALDERGFTALHAAAVTDNVGLAQAIVHYVPEAMAVGSIGGDTALQVAVRYGSARVADLLLRSGAAARDDDDAWPPLHAAARMDAVARAATLLASGADVDSKFHGKTALEVARQHGSRHVEVLLQRRR